MVEREVDAEAHDGTRQKQHDEQDGCVEARDLRRDLHAPEGAPADPLTP